MSEQEDISLSLLLSLQKVAKGAHGRQLQKRTYETCISATKSRSVNSETYASKMIKLKRQRKAPVDLQVKRMSLTKEKKNQV